MEGRVKEVKIIKPTIEPTGQQKIRMAAYCRVSTDSKDQINSFVAQIKYYNDYIRSHSNMILVDVYADEGITGTCIKKREEFKRMVRDCKLKKIDRIIVKSVQRFARNSLECIESIRELSEYGVSVYFENDNIDTKDMNSEMLLYVKSAFAQSEAMSASKRMSTSIRMKMEDGTYVISTAPYGYRMIDKELVICQEEAEIVRQIYNWYLSGMGMNLIVDKLNSMQTNENWNISHIRYILSNEKYIGDSLLQKTYTPDMIPFKKQLNNGQRTKYYVTDAHDAIISRDVFEKVRQLKLEKEKKYTKEYNNTKSFFSGKIRCRDCGWLFKRVFHDDIELWSCRKKGTVGTVCHSKTYSTDMLCSAYVKMYNRLKMNENILIDDTISQLQNLRVRLNKNNAQLSELDGEIANLSEQNAMYSKLYIKNIIDEITFHEKTDIIKKRIEENRIKRDKFLHTNEEECIDELRQLKRILDDAPGNILEMDRELFDSIVLQIYAEQNGDLTFCLRGGLQFRLEMRL